MLKNNLELLTIDLEVDKIHNKNVIINFVKSVLLIYDCHLLYCFRLKFVEIIFITINYINDKLLNFYLQLSKISMFKLFL